MKKLFSSITFIALFSVVLSGVAFGQTYRTQRNDLPESTISSGLKAALSQGITRAIRDLGRQNGFLDNPDVRIPLPHGLQRTESMLRFLGQGRKVDEFVASMNHAAENAVPVAADVFIDSVSQMSCNDARNILFSGQDDSATQFFRRTSEDRLRVLFRPIVEDFTAEVGVTQQYKSLMGRYGFIGRVFGQDATALDGYVTEKALDGLFYVMADEERRIRRDPIGRTTSILRTVFGMLR